MKHGVYYLQLSVRYITLDLVLFPLLSIGEDENGSLMAGMLSILTCEMHM